MEGLNQIAQAYYANGSERVQTLAHNFFNDMDDNGDGLITFAEFTSFMKEAGHDIMNSAAFFNWVDKDKNGTLDFMEVMTIYYIIKSGRPFCDHCNLFVKDRPYFVCVECFESVSKPYYLCTKCYGRKEWVHNHNGRRALFMDNFGLLESLRISALSKVGKGGQPSTSTAIVPTKAGKGGQPSTSTAIVPTKNDKLMHDLRQFEVALSLGSFITGTVSALSALSLCTIM